jgi:primosomal protein N' (replication factor Y)
MKDALQAGGQVMLFLNRRGFSTRVQCPSCGHVEKCRFCDVALTHHRQRGILLCHYCGYEQAPPEKCPACSKPEVRFQGLGTEKLEAEIAERFPGHVVRRMDSDTMKKPGSHQRLLDAFREGLVHILLGTQMIAKGLDFPNVTLVGVINADTGLFVPDFRAGERTFQLLSQVSGRTGRGLQGGKVLVQTFNPEHPCIALAASHDYLTFVQQELANRRALGYPPYQKMARLILRGRSPTSTGDAADRLAVELAETQRRLEPNGEAKLRILGPAEAPVFRLKNLYRYHFQIQSADPKLLHQLLRQVLNSHRFPSGVESALDIDPLTML